MSCLLVLPCLISMLTPWQEKAVILLQRELIVCCSRHLHLRISGQPLPSMTVGPPLLLLPLLLIIKLLSHVTLQPAGC